ncbi:MAG: hypothetical protein JWP61_2879 [Friedmanniella sp.]|nr:hypothetical protein [Friedmanniella sp.]
MPAKTWSLVLGALTGAVALLGMARLVAGAFSGGMSTFAWVMVLAAMVPWVVYCTWRGYRARLSRRSSGVALLSVALGLVLVWRDTWGEVGALALSMVSFVTIWTHDRPVRTQRGEERFVRISELQDDDED